MSPRLRLDTLLVERGMAESRTRARALILAGKVIVNGAACDKAGTLVAADADVTLTRPDHPYVSRGGVKLAHALDTFVVPVEGRTALDIGASTGGFTDVLLRRGARHVVALDVGHGQLDWRLRTDPRVTALEGINARSLRPEHLPADKRPFAIATIDVSFISLNLVLGPLPALLDAHAHVIVLVKPQFEAGRGEVGAGGLVTDPVVHARVLDSVTAAADRVGLVRIAMTPSPITGVEGNQEFFLHLRPRASS